MAKAIVMNMKAWYIEKNMRGVEEAIEKHRLRPKCDTPVKVYIWCAKAADDYFWDKIVKFYQDNGWCDKAVGECKMEFIEQRNAWGKRIGYVWRKYDIKFYDTPKTASEIGLEKPPWKWCYLEEEGEGEANDEK